MAKVNKIKLYPVEMRCEMAFCIAYCIGATYDNAEQISNTITVDEIDDCISLIRERMQKGQ